MPFARPGARLPQTVTKRDYYLILEVSAPRRLTDQTSLSHRAMSFTDRTRISAAEDMFKEATKRLVLSSGRRRRYDRWSCRSEAVDQASSKRWRSDGNTRPIRRRVQRWTPQSEWSRSTSTSRYRRQAALGTDKDR
jgi:hypothetical protein